MQLTHYVGKHLCDGSVRFKTNLATTYWILQICDLTKWISSLEEVTSHGIQLAYSMELEFKCYKSYEKDLMRENDFLKDYTVQIECRLISKHVLVLGGKFWLTKFLILYIPLLLTWDSLKRDTFLCSSFHIHHRKISLKYNLPIHVYHYASQANGQTSLENK